VTVLTLRRDRYQFVVTGPNIEPMTFKTRHGGARVVPPAFSRLADPRGGPRRQETPAAKRGERSLDRPMPRNGKTTRNTMADLKNLLCQEAAQCRRLAELATEQTIRQALMEMGARLEAIADEGQRSNDR
jgi:hypothetical protein